jgi:hypothetical protein
VAVLSPFLEKKTRRITDNSKSNHRHKRKGNCYAKFIEKELAAIKTNSHRNIFISRVNGFKILTPGRLLDAHFFFFPGGVL